jgi:hypothetical protein
MGHRRFYELLEKMRDIHDRKNSDYSAEKDPLSNFRLTEAFDVEPWLGVLVRITDKYSRIVQLTRKTLDGKEAAVADEKIQDTLIDLANYSILMIILYEEWLRKKRRCSHS